MFSRCEDRSIVAKIGRETSAATTSVTTSPETSQIKLFSLALAASQTSTLGTR